VKINVPAGKLKKNKKNKNFFASLKLMKKEVGSGVGPGFVSHRLIGTNPQIRNKMSLMPNTAAHYLGRSALVTKEDFVNYYNFNPIWIQHASIQVKKVLVSKSKKVIAKISYMIYSEPESEPK
jgi:hypothetical protein